jgi:hypothetical protein
MADLQPPVCAALRRAGFRGNSRNQNLCSLKAMLLNAGREFEEREQDRNDSEDDNHHWRV